MEIAKPIFLRIKFLIFSITFAVVLALDQVTKYLVHSRFKWEESLWVIPGFFSITYIRNKGAAFGFLHSAPTWFREPFFLVMPLLVMIYLLFFFIKLDARNSHWRLWSFGFSLILTGAIGNLIDRTRLGYVIDFLYFYFGPLGHYPAFNVADSAIVIGVALLLFLTFLDERSRKKPTR